LAGFLILFEAGEPVGLELGELFFHAGHGVVGESDNDDLIPGEGCFVEQAFQGGDDFRAAFDFDDEAFGFGDCRDDFGEAGNFFTRPTGVFPLTGVELAQFGERLIDDFGVPSGGSFGGGVVDDDDLIVLGEVDIDFDGVGVLFPGEVGGGDGIFGGLGGGAAMGNDLDGGEGEGEGREETKEAKEVERAFHRVWRGTRRGGRNIRRRL